MVVYTVYGMPTVLCFTKVEQGGQSIITTFTGFNHAVMGVRKALYLHNNVILLCILLYTAY